MIYKTASFVDFNAIVFLPWICHVVKEFFLIPFRNRAITPLTPYTVILLPAFDIVPLTNANVIHSIKCLLPF